MRPQLAKALRAGLEATESFSGMIEISGTAPETCPICGQPVCDETSQTDSNAAFEEFFVGCSPCDIWWYTHEEPIY